MIAPILSALWLLTACSEGETEVSSPRYYDQSGVFFHLPKSWRVTEDYAVENLRYIFVESPGNALAILQFYGMDHDMSLIDYAKHFSELAKRDTPAGSFSASTFTQENESRVEERYTVSLEGQETTYVREYSKRARDDAVCFLTFQVPEEDLGKTQGGFELIAESFDWRMGGEG